MILRRKRKSKHDPTEESHEGFFKRSLVLLLGGSVGADGVVTFPAGAVMRPQFKYHPHRKWHSDFMLSSERFLTPFLVEIEGAPFGIGKPCPTCGQRRQAHHTFGATFELDATKHCEAAALGYRLLRFTTKQVDDLRAQYFCCWLITKDATWKRAHDSVQEGIDDALRSRERAKDALRKS